MKKLFLAMGVCMLSSASFAALTTISSNAINVKAIVQPACVFIVSTDGGYETALPGQNAFGPDLSFGLLTPDPGAYLIKSSKATALVRCTLGTTFTTSTSSTSSPPFNMHSATTGANIPYTTIVSPISGSGLGMGTTGSATGNITISVEGEIVGTAYDVKPATDYIDATLKLNITY